MPYRELYIKLRVFHARCTRAMYRMNRLHTRKYRITTEELLQRLDLKPIDAYINRWQLQWAGHVMHMPYERLPTEDGEIMDPSKRLVGCPPFTYDHGLYKSLENAEIPRAEWATLATDRIRWRELISHMR